MSAQFLVHETISHDVVRGAAKQNSIWPGQCLQTRREVWRLAHDGLLACGAFANRLADNNKPGRNTHTHGELHPITMTDILIERRHRLDDR